MNNPGYPQAVSADGGEVGNLQSRPAFAPGE